MLNSDFIKQSKVSKDFLSNPFKIRVESQDDRNCTANKGSRDGYCLLHLPASSYHTSLQCYPHRIVQKGSKVNLVGDNE